MTFQRIFIELSSKQKLDLEQSMSELRKPISKNLR